MSGFARSFFMAVLGSIAICGIAWFVTLDPNPFNWHPFSRGALGTSLFVWWLTSWVVGTVSADLDNMD